MKSFVFLFLITATLAVSAFAQTAKPKIAALPADIARWGGEDSAKILNNPVIKTRLGKLLGAKNYASFLESFETLNPVEKSGDVLFSSGCLIHACTHLESAIAIDVVHNIIYAAIYREDEKTKFFREKRIKIPEQMKNWANRFKGLNEKH